MSFSVPTYVGLSLRGDICRRHDLLFEENIERDIHEGFQKIKCTIDSQLQTLGQRMREVQDGLSADQAKFETTTLRLATQVVAMQKGFHSTNRNALRQHSKTRDQITQGNTKIIHSICSKIEELPGNLAQTYLTARKNGREVRFNGESLEAMLSPLLLLKPGLRQAIIKLLSQHSELSSAQHLYWLQSEFENLVSSATQEVAAISEGSTATPFDTWVYSRKVASLLSIQNSPSRMAISRKRSRHKHELSNEQTVSEAKVQRKRLKSKSQSFSFTLPTGEVQIMVSRPDGGSPSGSRPCDVSEVGFSFSPKPDISSTSIHGRFVKAMDPLPQPRLYAELNAFNVMEDLYPEYYMELIHDGTLEEIDTALRVGKISPYNINKNGQNICLHVRTPF